MQNNVLTSKAKNILLTLTDNSSNINRATVNYIDNKDAIIKEQWYRSYNTYNPGRYWDRQFGQ